MTIENVIACAALLIVVTAWVSYETGRSSADPVKQARIIRDDLCDMSEILKEIKSLTSDFDTTSVVSPKPETRPKT